MSHRSWTIESIVFHTLRAIVIAGCIGILVVLAHRNLHAQPHSLTPSEETPK